MHKRYSYRNLQERKKRFFKNFRTYLKTYHIVRHSAITSDNLFCEWEWKKSYTGANLSFISIRISAFIFVPLYRIEDISIIYIGLNFKIIIYNTFATNMVVILR